MAVHSDGLGVTWGDIENLDVDQPHGLDYRQLNHIAKAVRKRLNKEHVDFGDSTAGGEHVPGGCAVLDIVDASDDVTDGWNDGTYTGGGLVYSLCGALYVCSTLDTTYDGATDVTLVKLHPDTQWGGQDVTWTSGHEFDASVDITGNLAVDGDISCDGTGHFGTLVSVGDFSMDGTAVFGGDVSIDGAVKIDGTACEFGKTAGIGLFYDPTAYTGGETSTLGNSLIFKMGTTGAIAGGGTADVSFGTAFPNGLLTAQVSQTVSNASEPMIITARATTGLTIKNATGNAGAAPWMAIGY